MKKLIMVMPNDMDKVYAMGYDVWGLGKNYVDYLEECRTSIKYKKGTWYALSINGTMLALVFYMIYLQILLELAL